MVRDISEEIFTGQPKPETLANFYQTLARATIQWQRVEMALHRIALAAILPTIQGAFSAGFCALEHTAAQLRLADAAVQFWCTARPTRSASLQDRWDKLHKRINRELKCRNRLAHFTVYVAAQNEREHEKIFLEPTFVDTRFPIGKPKTRYTLSEIHAAETRFVTLSRDMWDYRAEMERHEARFAAHLR